MPIFTQSSKLSCIYCFFVTNDSLSNAPKPSTPPRQNLYPDNEKINGNYKILIWGGGRDGMLMGFSLKCVVFIHSTWIPLWKTITQFHSSCLNSFLNKVFTNSLDNPNSKDVSQGKKIWNSWFLDNMLVESGHFATRPMPLRRTLWSTRPADLTPFFVA